MPRSVVMCPVDRTIIVNLVVAALEKSARTAALSQ